MSLKTQNFWLRCSCYCWILVGLSLAQRQPGQFIIRVEDVESNGATAGRFNFNFGNFGLEAVADNVDIATLGEVGLTTAGPEAELPAPDVVVGDLSLLQRNNLVAAAGNVQTSAPAQRFRTLMNSGLRRRRTSTLNADSDNAVYK